jgi:hypothetical protein
MNTKNYECLGTEQLTRVGIPGRRWRIPIEIQDGDMSLHGGKAELSCCELTWISDLVTRLKRGKE